MKQFRQYLFPAVALAFLAGSSAIAAETLSFPSTSKYGGKPVTLTGEFKKAGDRKPLVILLHGCGGVDGAVRSSLRSHASTLGRAGFSTLILDSFNPRGISGGWVCNRDSRMASAQAYRQRDVSDAVDHFSTENLIDPGNIFVLGQSNGGSAASLIALQPIKGIRAAVSFYPWCGAVPINPKIPLLVLSGEADDWTPPDQCKRFDKEGDKLTVVTYPDAVHSFDLDIAVQIYKGHKVGGNPKARSDAKKRMVSFFKSHRK